VEELAHRREQMRNQHFVKPMPGNVCQCLLARRSVFDAVGRFDEGKRLGEDTDWFMRAMRAGIAKETLADTLVYRRIHEQNMPYGLCEPSNAPADLLETRLQPLQALAGPRTG